MALMITLSTGCAAQRTSAHRPKPTIIVDSSLPQDAVPAWLYYAGSRSLWIEKKYWERNPGATSYEYTFEEEVAARQACAAVWQHARESQNAKPDRYLDELVAVAKAGYVPEYTWAYFKQSQWAQPPELRMSEFDVWRKMHLMNHRPKTRALVQLTRD
jgi:hypothetical protein